MSETTTPIVTGSSVVGCTYKDGVLMCTDTLASYGRMARFRDVCRFTQWGQDTLGAASGEISDWHALSKRMEARSLDEWVRQDEYSMDCRQYASLIGKIMYEKRLKINPFYNSILVGGVSGPAGIVVPQDSAQDPYIQGKPAIYSIDMYGTFFKGDIAATGLGRYFALGLLREEHRPDMDREAAKQLIERAMEILFYRDCSASDRIQFAYAEKGKVVVEQPYRIGGKWNLSAWTAPGAEMPLAGCSW